MEDVLKWKCVSTVVPSVEPNHVDKSISVVFEVRTELTCWTLPVVPMEVDSGRKEDVVSLDWLILSGVPEYVLDQASAGCGECEMLFVTSAISVDDSAVVMFPAGKERSLVLPFSVVTE